MSFGAPHGFCDRRCERCPLRARCPVAELDRRMAAAQAEGAPDPFPALVALAIASIEHVVAEEAGVDDGPVDASVQAERLPVLSRSYGVGLVQLGRAAQIGPHGAVAGELAHDALAFVAKCAFVSAFYEPVELDDDAFQAVGAPVVLLIEVLVGKMQRALEAMLEPDELAAFDRIHAELGRALAPLVERVSDASRAELAALVARGEAPSPFLVDDELVI